MCSALTVFSNQMKVGKQNHTSLISIIVPESFVTQFDLTALPCSGMLLVSYVIIIVFGYFVGVFVVIIGIDSDYV